MDDIPKDILKGAAQIAEYIGEDERRTYYLLERGHIPGFKVGRHWHSRKSMLDRVYSGEVA